MPWYNLIEGLNLEEAGDPRRMHQRHEHLLRSLMPSRLAMIRIMLRLLVANALS